MENNRMGEFLAALRKSKGYTQQEVADTLGVSNKTVSSWETGASCPDISMLPVLAELYGVMCDEIIRGKRLNTEEDPSSPVRREKAMKHLLQKQKNNLFTVCWIAGGLAGLAFLLTSIVGYAALKSLLAFFLGLIFHAASVITAIICIGRIRFHVGDPWESEPALRFSLSLNRAMFWIAFGNAAVFGFDLPHCFIPAGAGLRFEGENLLIQLLFALGAAALAFLIGCPILFHLRKKLLQSAAEQGSPELLSSIAALSRKTALSSWRIKHLSLVVLLPFLVLAAVCSAFLVTASKVEVNAFIFITETMPANSLVGSESSQEGPFSAEENNEYTLVSEEQPASDDETGKYKVVYLFPDFPEEWREYYLTEETDEGTLVSIWKYRIAATETGKIFEFYALDYEWQGGLSSGTILYQGFDEQSQQDVYTATLIFGPTIPQQHEVYRQEAELKTFLGLAAGFGALALLSFAVTIPLYIRQERKFKKTL